MDSDFTAARAYLERAHDVLRGNDKTSRQTKLALDLLIEAVAVAEFRRKGAEIISFPDLVRNGRSK